MRNETSPEDVHGMMVAEGILTSRGGLVSHAAVVARGWGIPAVVGAADVHIDGDTVTIGDTTLRAGDPITIVILAAAAAAGGMISLLAQSAFLKRRFEPLRNALALEIPDPDEIHPEPGPFRFPFWTIESVLVHDDHRLLIANDNNYPFGTGRSGVAGTEGTEFALIRFPVRLSDLRVRTDD